MEKDKLRELVEKLDENDTYILFFCGMLEKHLEKYENIEKR